MIASKDPQAVCPSQSMREQSMTMDEGVNNMGGQHMDMNQAA